MNQKNQQRVQEVWGLAIPWVMFLCIDTSLCFLRIYLSTQHPALISNLMGSAFHLTQTQKFRHMHFLFWCKGWLEWRTVQETQFTEKTSSNWIVLPSIWQMLTVKERRSEQGVMVDDALCSLGGIQNIKLHTTQYQHFCPFVVLCWKSQVKSYFYTITPEIFR